MADASSRATIKPGSAITARNWRQYRQFMTFGTQLLWSGQYFWKLPPDAVMVVGPTIPYDLPEQYRIDTEKYGGQAKLVRQADGGYLLANYVAGLPFPNPREPQLGEKLFFNKWYGYFPFVISAPSDGLALDRYGNSYASTSWAANYRLTHLSEPKMPVNSPYAGSGAGMVYNVSYVQVVAPEQSKYTTILDRIPEDLQKDQEFYVFVPALRRSLRLSTAARCAPLNGSDYIPDDIYGFNGHIAKFAVKYLGTKRLLTMEHETAPLLPSGRNDIDTLLMPYYYEPVMFPKPSAGKWELRDVIVLRIDPLETTGNRGYCIRPRILYYDAQTGWPLAYDEYDVNHKLWKFHLEMHYPVRVPSGGHIPSGPIGNWGMMWDLQNAHLTLSAPVESPMKVNEDAGLPFTDPVRYTTPSGLDQIMQ